MPIPVIHETAALITSVAGFVFLFLLFAAGALGSLLLGRRAEPAARWGGFFAAAGCLYGLIFAAASFVSGGGPAFAFRLVSFPLISIACRVDLLSAFFIFVVSLTGLFCSVYSFGYVRHYFGRYSLGALGFFFNALIASILLIVTASNGIFFLFAWELMAVSSYFLIVYDRDDLANVRAGFLYFVMTYVATAFIIAAFLLAWKYTGSFDFSAIRAGAAAMPPAVRNAVFALAVVGFGTKAGIIPFHIWLPAAHSAAPSHVSAFLSGVMIKTGIYMMIRVFLDLLAPVPLWWGLALLLIGSVSSLLGVLYAITEHDLKRLLAYHSIENIGIILLGLGSAAAFSSIGMMPLALLGLTASLFHVLNHATFKSLLFLGAGAVINATHTRNMEEHGGLIKLMPWTAFFFLTGSMAISALPPFNGFFSEWLTFQSLFRGITFLNSSGKWIFITAAAALAFTGGLALACFVKAFGAVFLARPRSAEAEHAKEAANGMRIAMGALSALALLFGLFAGRVTAFIQTAGRGIGQFHAVHAATSASGGTLAVSGFASVSGQVFFALVVLAALAAAFIVRRIYPEQKTSFGRTWDCGTDLTPRMEITATGFARSLIMIFKGVLKPSIQRETEYHDADNRYLPKSRTVIVGVGDVHQSYFYRPLREIFRELSLRTRKIQGGNINVYILYIFITLVVTLYWVI